jgi:antimicrobial peptide ABC superfamily ATP binding cassette transporter, permease protein
VMLMTSAAVVSLSARGREREIALLQTAGMPGRQVGLLILSESFAMSLGALIIAFVPIIAGGLVCSLVSSAALGGRIMVLWPTLEMLLGFVISWLALFFILLVPALRPLREGPGQQLREQGLS